MSLECLLKVSEPNVFWRFHSATAISLALVELQEELAKHARHQMTAKEKRQQQACSLTPGLKSVSSCGLGLIIFLLTIGMRILDTRYPYDQYGSIWIDMVV